MIPLQSVTEIQEIVATNNATVSGVLLAISLTFGLTIFYLFKHIAKITDNYQNKIEMLQSKYIEELKAMNTTLLNVNNSYQEIALKILKNLDQK